MNIVHADGLAVQNGPVLALAFQGVLDFHSRIAALHAELHLRGGMVSIDGNTFHFAIHGAQVQVRPAIQSLFNACAYGSLIVPLRAAPRRHDAGERDDIDTHPSFHFNFLPRPSEDHCDTISIPEGFQMRGD